MLTPTEMRTVLKQRENDAEKLEIEPAQTAVVLTGEKESQSGQVLLNSSQIVSCT